MERMVVIFELDSTTTEPMHKENGVLRDVPTHHVIAARTPYNPFGTYCCYVCSSTIISLMSEASDVDIRICLSADEQGPVHALVGKGYGLSNGKMERLTLYADAIVPSRMDDTCEQVDIKTPYK
ncbi:unnamed protein product [Albugo candida]|uniref:Uncharacterized protein n=1 Tax=Albugo candida TaxID=65357 RepID=A0A024GFA1_9STRA|nr:unnamed protein product [Albugo candida]|eukprot:CCI45554.1 unnamed protein product [Albugo candida]